jgi:HK97 family phage prohead protease
MLFRDGNYEVWEQVDRDAFAEADMEDIILQYDHVGRVFARKSNGTLAVTPDEVGLRIHADLGGTELGRQLYEEIKGGYTTKMSFGFKVAEDRKEVTEGEDLVKVLRTITKIGRVYDVSAVSLPANDATSISARSYGEGVIAELRQELLEREEHERKKEQIKLLLEL